MERENLQFPKIGLSDPSPRLHDIVMGMDNTGIVPVKFLDLGRLQRLRGPISALLELPPLLPSIVPWSCSHEDQTMDFGRIFKDLILIAA